MIATGVGSCAIAAAVGAPAIRLVLAPLSEGASGGRWVRTIRLTDLAENQPKRVALVSDRHDAWSVEKNVELGSVWLVRRGEKIAAFSAVCPHLGCSVNAVAGGSFACPCHTSAFDADGKRQSGPAPRDLDALATRIVDGMIEIELRRFRIGVPEKVEA